MQEENMGQLVEALDASLRQRINIFLFDRAENNARLYNVSFARALSTIKKIGRVHSKRRNIRNPILSDKVVAALQEARIQFLAERSTQSFLCYIKVANIVRDDRWERFERTVEQHLRGFGEVDLSLMCHLVELKFVLHAGFELASRLPGASAQPFETLRAELPTIIGFRTSAGKRFLNALEKSYRKDLNHDLEEFGIAWIEELHNCYEKLKDVSKIYTAVLLVGCPEAQEALVMRLWGAGYVRVNASEVAAILDLLATNNVDRCLLCDAHHLDWALLRQFSDRRTRGSCHLIGLIPDSRAEDDMDMDAGTLSRFYPIRLTQLEPYKSHLLEGKPTSKECAKLRQSVAKGTYGHYSDLLILAALKTRRMQNPDV